MLICSISKKNLFHVVGILCLCSFQSALSNTTSGQVDKHNNTNWTFLLLAQFWPSTSCYIYFGKEGCDGVPSNVRHWTIHGLWPSGPGTSWPEYCDNSNEFNYNNIKNMSSALDTVWHNYNSKKEETYLWQHEWDKHGTCGVTVPELDSQYKYFQKTMDLYNALNFTGVLAARGIVPSEDVPYKPADFFNAILAEYKVKPFIACRKQNDDDKYYIEEIYICYTKTFSFRDCVPSTNSDSTVSFYRYCPPFSTKNVFYLPIQPMKPNGGYQMKFVVYTLVISTVMSYLCLYTH